jgi:hypothetical protein
MGIVLTNPEHIAIFRMVTLRSALKLESLGMKRKGQSVFSIIKKEYNLTGDKSTVLEKFGKLIALKKRAIGIVCDDDGKSTL